MQLVWKERNFSSWILYYRSGEAGEGKSRLDSHFAHISHKIVRWVHTGNDFESGEQVAELVKVINQDYYM